jgi:hypothetical protein
MSYAPMPLPSPTLARNDFGSKDGRRFAAMTPPLSRESLKREPLIIKTEIAP